MILLRTPSRSFLLAGLILALPLFASCGERERASAPLATETREDRMAIPASTIEPSATPSPAPAGTTAEASPTPPSRSTPPDVAEEKKGDPPMEETEGELIIISLDGSPELSLGTTGSAPAWSPDGSRIAFASRQSEPDSSYHALFVINVDGTGQQRLSPPLIASQRVDRQLAWAPDGSRIAIEAGITHSGIFIVPLDGSLSDHLGVSLVSGSEPVWSPDGRLLAYTAWIDRSQTGVYVINADGTEPRLLAAVGAEQLAWSPDGSRILFTTRPVFEESPAPPGFLLHRTYVINADGSGLKLVEGFPDSGLDASWSPDGSRIVYTALSAGIPNIYVVGSSGGSDRLTTGGGQDPAWSPDGSKIAFRSNLDDDWDVYVMDADGSNQINLTDNDLQDFDFAWSPDGIRLVVARADRCQRDCQ